MVEHCFCTAGVSGSSPLISIFFFLCFFSFFYFLIVRALKSFSIFCYFLKVLAYSVTFWWRLQIVVYCFTIRTSFARVHEILSAVYVFLGAWCTWHRSCTYLAKQIQHRSPKVLQVQSGALEEDLYVRT